MVEVLWQRYGSVVGSIILFSLAWGATTYGQETPTMSCALPEGVLSVSIISGTDWWNYRWTQSGINFLGEKEKLIPMEIAKAGNRLGGDWDESKAGVDKLLLGNGSRLDVPFMVSPNGNLLAIAVYNELPEELSPLITTDMAIIRRSDQTVVHQFQFPNYIKALSWAPSGQYFAVLLAESVAGPISRTFFDWLGAIGGHPSSYYTLRVGIYNVEGIELCTQLYQEQVPEGRGFLEWNAS